MTQTGTRTLLADGGVALVRALGPRDADDVRALHQRLDAHDAYLRFLSAPPRQWTALINGIVTPADGHAVGAFVDDTLIGVGHFVPVPGTEVGATDGVAEVALVVDGHSQAHGVGTLLLEHLAAVARERGIRRFLAYVSARNIRMLRVLSDLGLPCDFGSPGQEREVVISLREDQRYADAVLLRERHAEVHSLTALLKPRSVAVIGASRRTGTVGRAVLDNLTASFPGRVVAVNPHADRIGGVDCVPAISACPEAPDLAVVCVPAASVAMVVEECGARGVRAVVVITSGLSGTPAAGEVRASVRQHGLRLVGPNCVGVLNTAEGVQLDASFLAGPVPAGSIGVVTQSGGVGIAVVEALRELGLGVSTLVSTGDKYDVSGNDLLLWWLTDPATSAVVLYTESFGDPRKFGRVARAVSRRKPVIAVRAATTADGRRAAGSHTASTATPAAVRDALFRQAGVIGVDTLSELTGLVAALAWQPLPAGGRIAVIGNAGGIGVLTADACVRHGLTLARLRPRTRRRLARLLPSAAGLDNPVDTTAAVSARTFAACLRALLDDDGVDAVLAEPLATAVSDPAESLGQVAATRTKPVLAVRAGQNGTIRPVCHDGEPVTACFSDPDVAAATISHLVGYATWLATSADDLHSPDDAVDRHAHPIARAWLGANPAGGWTDPETTAALLDSAGLPLLGAHIADDEDAAVLAAVRIGEPVAMKAVAEGLLHKAAGGGVLLDLSGDEPVRAAYRTLRERFGDRLHHVLVQPMAAGGRELLVGISHLEQPSDGTAAATPDPGALVVFGLGGTDTDLVDDRVSALVPLSDGEARRMVHGLRSARLLFTEVDEVPLAELLVRVGRLAVAVPEIAELDLNPVRYADGRCQVLDARIRLIDRPSATQVPRALRG